MRVPHTKLSQKALRGVVEEFVTRDGTDHTAVEQRIVDVLRQLDNGSAELHSDEQGKTCTILPATLH
jgi:uncharacterized protein YheU (UPF0270 family)